MGPNALMLITNLVCVNCCLNLMLDMLFMLFTYALTFFLHQVLIDMPFAYIALSLTCCSYHVARTLLLFGIRPAYVLYALLSLL